MYPTYPGSPRARGASGAKVVLRNGFAEKRGGIKVVAQGNWLVEHRTRHLPKVDRMIPDGYRMELLHELPDNENSLQLLRSMVSSLRWVWDQQPTVGFNRLLHTQKVNKLCSYDRDIARAMKRRREQIDWIALPKNLVHGDPTWDNTMMNDFGELVLIDPIPATHSVPDMRCVDLGKLLQSAVGYEAVVYSRPGFSGLYRGKVTREHVLEYAEDDNERRAAHYWCIVHLLRCIPYQPRDLIRQELRGMIRKELLWTP